MSEDKVFEHADLSGARFRDVNLRGARFEQVSLNGAVLRGVELVDVTISGEVRNVVINDVDVVPLVQAELDRRFPDRDPHPWHPLDLPFDEMADTPGVPRDYTARPTLDEVLALRTDRMTTVRQVIQDLTEAKLEAHTDPIPDPGWPPSISFPIRECLLCILNEEWQHRLYAERDLGALESTGRQG